jgi:PadR family transcriptional regulator, regulatory protein PadR
MAKREHLGELEALVLACVIRVGDGANGAAVYRELEARGGRDPGVAAVHVTLRRLEEKGYLGSDLGTPSRRGGRPRRWYAPTDRGMQALGAFRRMWKDVLSDLVLPEPEAGR